MYPRTVLSVRRAVVPFRTLQTVTNDPSTPIGFSAGRLRLVPVLGALLALLVTTSSMRGLTDIRPALIAAAFLFLILLRGNPAWIIHATLVVLFMTSVPEIPRGIRVGGLFVYYYEILIGGSAAFAAYRLRKNPEALMLLKRSASSRVATVLAGVLILGVGIALIRGNSIWDIQYDLKPVAEMVIAMAIAAVIVALDDWQRYVKTITVILMASAALTLYASATGFILFGRTEIAQLTAAGGRALSGGSNAVRFITPTAPLALAVVLGSVVLLLLGRITTMRVLPLLIPALIVTILSFSRNTLLALAGTLVFAILIAVSNRLIARLLLRLAMVPVVIAISAIGVLSIGGALGAHDWIATQATGYTNRVFAGLDEANEREDTSANYRDLETEQILRVGANHPVFGGGFGTHYKAPFGKRGTFTAVEGTMYAHNAYNWLYLKVGVVGATVFLTLILLCAFPALIRRRNSDLLSTASGTLVGLSFAMFVAPLPIEEPGAALLGVVFGVCIGSGLPKRSAELGHRAAAIAIGR